MDRRVRRTRERLQQALAELIEAHGYDAVTVQQIVEQADVGRTTFYLHFKNKDDLFVSSHQDQVAQLASDFLSRDDLLGENPPPSLTAFYQYHLEQRDNLRDIYLTKDADVIQRHLREMIVRQIHDSLQRAFAEDASTIPFHVLANYLAGSQIALMTWWLTKRQPYTPEFMAVLHHRLQRAAIREALRL
jgi:AcrR family transcriptional regulator